MVEENNGVMRNLEKYFNYILISAIAIVAIIFTINSWSMRVKLNKVSGAQYEKLINQNDSIQQILNVIQENQVKDIQMIDSLRGERANLYQSLNQIDVKLKAIPTKYEKVHYSILRGDTSTILRVLSDF